MIIIEQDVLCDYCEGCNDGIDRDTCDGAFCEDARTAYLDSSGISDEIEKTLRSRLYYPL